LKIFLGGLAARLRNFPLRIQLMLVFALVAVATTVISTLTLSILDGQRLHEGLQVKSAQYSRHLQRQLQSILEPDTRLTARELFDSLIGDRDVDGLGVYMADGELIEGRGNRPDRLSDASAESASDQRHIVSVTGIDTREKLAGRLYVSLTTAPIDALHRRNMAIAAAVAVAVVLAALASAVMISRRLARRLVDISAAANRMAAGDLTESRLDETAQDEIGELAHAFNVMVSELNRLSKEHERLVSTERDRLERLVLERTGALEQSREMFRLIAESTNATPFKLDMSLGCFPYIGNQGVEKSGIALSRWQEPGALDAIIPRSTNPDIRSHFDDCAAGPFEFEATFTRLDGARMEMRWTGTCEIAADGKILRGLMQDVTELRRLERELTAAQKLESVGRLAAGVAHEINTPLQFVTDNVQFVRTSMEDIGGVIAAYRSLQETVATGGDVTAAALRARDAEQKADLDYLIDNTPLAIGDAVEGLGRITTIVRSMKEFAHPDQAQKTFADLNQAIKSTLVIAHNEYKYVAEMQTDFGELPPVQCYLGEINQVVLNLLVNASHAIGDVVGNSGRMGKIVVRTRHLHDEVEIAISDTGGGIPESAREKLYDPFFTTKAVGKGTGQGLAIARSVVVNKHAGSLRFETELGVGTTFFIRLPIKPPVDAEHSARAAA